MGKKKNYSYDINDPFDRSIILDLPFDQLNKRGRKAKKHQMRDNPERFL
jgi:hypothetical protein